MKAIRHEKIKNIIEHEVIETQEELAEALCRHHIEVTQATVSRDIKELMLIKVPTRDGRSRYAAPMGKNAGLSKERMVRIFQDSVTGLDASENIIVVKTLPGMAGAVASVIDCSKWPEIIGTVAGDDNIIVVVKPREAVDLVMRKMGALAF